MKICQLLLSQGEGGLEKHVRELSIQLADSGQQIAVVADRQFLSALPAGIERHAVPTGLGRRNPLLHVYLRHTLRRINADIVHAQANKAAFVLSRLNSSLSAVTVGTVHNIKRDVTSFSRLDHVITVSRGLAERFNQQHSSVIYNGIEMPSCIQRDLHAAFNLMPDAPVLLAVGRLVPAKGFDILLEAIDGLKVNLILIGDGPEMPRLRLQASKLSAETRVCIAGERKDASSLMASADAVLISSRREGFSYVLSEALLSGCRVLSTDVPVANEVLPDDLITPIENPSLFRERLVALLTSPVQWSALMQPAHQQAQQKMTLTSMGQATLATYHRLLPPHAELF